MGFFGNLFGKGKKEESGKITCKDKTIYSPLAGTVIPLAEVEDPVFSQGMMGLGVGIIPAEGSYMLRQTDRSSRDFLPVTP